MIDYIFIDYIKYIRLFYLDVDVQNVCFIVF